MDWVPLAGGGVDLSQQLAVLGERKVRLTTKERDLLGYLARHPGRTVTRSELLVHVWGNPATGSEEPVYSTVKRLRAKIDGGSHRHIVGVHGDGYRWEPPIVAAPGDASSRTRGRFFGRETELAAVAAAFSAGASLVTLVGPGGAGKTRCALELGATRPHVFCDLSSATTEGHVLSAIASSLGVPLAGAEPAEWVRGVGLALAARPGQLVVLDNAEQVIQTVATVVAAWLPAKPTLLVTSREPLRLEGETVVALGPLPPEHAISLLADRIGLSSTADVDHDVYREIVEQVDRLPLAVELAAVQVHDLGARSLLASLSSQLHTLVAGARDGPARHATLRAAVEWSWSFLEPREQTVLSDLAIFSGSFAADAAVAVIDDGAATGGAATLSSLVRRCQVQRTGERFALYAAVRELAREKGGDRSAAVARHAEYFARTSEAAVLLLEGAEHRDGARRLAEDQVELRAAFEAAIERDPVLAARLALGLDRALGLSAARSSSRRELLSRARCALEAAAAADERGEGIPKDLRARVHLFEGRLEGAAQDLLDQALVLASGTDVELEVRLARAERAAATDPTLARAELEAALPLAQGARHAAVRGRLLALLGEVFAWLGLVREASTHLRAALALHREVTDRRATARTSALLAHVDRLETGGGAARALLSQAEQAADELGDPVVAARVLLDLGQHLTRTGDQSGARAALDLAGRTYERLGFARDRAFLDLHIAETLVGVGDLEAALLAALAAWSALPEDVGRSTVYEAIGCVQMLRGDLPEAECWIEEGLEIARASGAARSECTLLGKRGLLSLAKGEVEAAWADFDTAAKKNEARGSIAIAAASLSDCAMASFALGRDDEGRASLARARQMLHDPSEEQASGRMLAACETVGRAFFAARAGDAASAHAEARRQTERLFHRPPHEWDVVLRLLDWLIDRIASCPASSAPARRAPAASSV